MAENSLEKIKKGDSVVAHIEVRSTTGVVYENTVQSGSPILINVGESDCPYIFLHNALDGTTVGATTALDINGEEVFGPYDEKMVFWAPKALFDPQTVDFEKLEPGSLAEFRSEKIGVFHATVVEKSSKSVKLDTNHPYAKKNLICNIVAIEKNTQNGEKHGKTEIR